ncbi:MAG: cell division protein FtsA, partial [Ignavibacteria bacterium]|nr:cell division protein FtsA [Ignavibacteria bacterium]
ISLLTQIISLRMRELFTLMDHEIKNAGFKNKIKAGIVLTGGGSLLRGTTELAEEVFGLPARIGVPLESATGGLIEIEKPEFATVAGLICGIPGSQVETIEVIEQETKKRKNRTKEIWNNFRQFFDEL